MMNVERIIAKYRSEVIDPNGFGHVVAFSTCCDGFDAVHALHSAAFTSVTPLRG
ncbi:MAG: hypothetical protein ACJAR2_002658 [Ilumatobacter sp.]|jgi:hypothetical protein